MFIETQNKITAALKELAEFKTTGVWQGDIEDLLTTAHNLPSAHAILSSAEFAAPAIIGATVAPSETLWSVVVISQNLRDRQSGAAESLPLIELVLAALTRLDTGFGWLWPARVQFIGAEKGKSAYGLQFIVEKDT